jgi:hypothetical protein
VYNVNYQSLESYQKLSTASTLAMSAAAQAASQAASNQRLPSNHPESLGDPGAALLPPPARASFNFLELKKLPQSQQYLYLVVHHAFTSLASVYGFQHDNVANQYEHFLFLLSNFQNKVANVNVESAGGVAAGETFQGASVRTPSPAMGSSTASSGSSTGSGGPNLDAISQTIANGSAT